MKEIIAAIWKLEFEGRSVTLESISEEVGDCALESLEDRLMQREKGGLVKKEGNCFKLTERGRNTIEVVVCGGVFDILHPGHAFILDKAKSLGDVLVVIVARDSTVEMRKRIPIIPEEQRVEMVNHIKPVDIGILGYEGDPLKIIEDIGPDVIAIGPDQHHDAELIKEEIRKRGINAVVRRIEKYKECRLNSTKAILQRIIERNYPNSRGG